MKNSILYEGPDISYHNGIVDIKRVRDFGCKRVGIRVGYGKNNVDQKYIVNAQACCNLGVSVLPYWFSYSYSVPMAVAEAGYAIHHVGKYWASCPIAFDFEYDSVNYARKNGVIITKELATDMAIAFLNQIKCAGYIPVIYTNKDYSQNYFDLKKIFDELGQVYIWYARYTSAASTNNMCIYGASVADIWQYTSTGRVPGINGNVDMNRFYIDFKDDIINSEREIKSNLNIKSFQAAANADSIRDMNGNELVEDGIDGVKTQYVRRQIALIAKKSGHYYVVGSSGHVVKWWQMRCNEILSCSKKTDGLFGEESRNATIEVQKKLGLKVDGIVGYNSIQAAFYN